MYNVREKMMGGYFIHLPDGAPIGLCPRRSVWCPSIVFTRHRILLGAMLMEHGSSGSDHEQMNPEWCLGYRTLTSCIWR